MDSFGSVLPNLPARSKARKFQSAEVIERFAVWQAMMYLVSDAATMVTGTMIAIDASKSLGMHRGQS